MTSFTLSIIIIGFMFVVIISLLLYTLVRMCRIVHALPLFFKPEGFFKMVNAGPNLETPPVLTEEFLYMDGETDLFFEDVNEK